MLSEQEQKSDLHSMLLFVRTHIKLLCLYALVGGSIAVAVTFFIEKEYKSYGIVFPPSSTSIENSIDYPNFGYDVEADRLMQIFESRDIRDSVIERFDLKRVFKVDTVSADWRDNLFKLYYKNIKLERTTSMAVLITARTNDAVLSANIVNYMIKAADAFRENLYKRNLVPAFEEATHEYFTQQRKVDSLEKTLVEHLHASNLSSLLMLYSDAQISVDIDKIKTANSTNSPQGIGAEIINYKSAFEVMKEAKGRYLKIKKTIQNPIPKIFVISYAEPHFKKVSPSFTINALIGAALGLVLAFVVLLSVKSIETNAK